jgi:hypothetical protein
MDHVKVIEMVADLVLKKRIKEAEHLINTEYKHDFIKYEARSMSADEKLKIYLRDGFIDRYTGRKLLFPNVLWILTSELGTSFPFHANWKMSECHIAYWELMPTCDHALPIARGGLDTPENILTTCQIMNSAKSNFLIEEVGFSVYPCGTLSEWDGMIGWYKA